MEKAIEVLEQELSEAIENMAAASGTDPGARPRLERLIATLSDAQRAAVTMFYHEDRSVEEVATALEMPVGTVKTHLHRARAALRATWLGSKDEGAR